VKYGMASKLRDFFARRIRMEILDWRATMSVVDKVAAIFQKELGWSNEESAANLKEYLALLDKKIATASI
jgi:glycerol-3-phosphate dehydrogenase